MKIIYGVIDERTQMAKRDTCTRKTQRLICKTLHEHNGMVMQKLKIEGRRGCSTI